MEIKKELEVVSNIDKDTLKKHCLSYLKNTNQNLNESQLYEFIAICLENNLNPLKREVYAVSYKDKFNVITNYYEYLKRADKTGLLDYYNVDIKVNEKGFPEVGTFVGKRRDQSKELVMTFYFKEWNGGQALWISKPNFMFDKCILANGLRRLFPNDLGNMPYVNEELWYWNQENVKAIDEHIKQEQQELGVVLDNEKNDK